MTDQLTLELPASERRYTCCGNPAPALSERPTAERPFPHTSTCTNPSVVGGWVHRATGMIIRRLGCGSKGELTTCPHGGAAPAREGMWDPHGGRCCIVIREATDRLARLEGDPNLQNTAARWHAHEALWPGSGAAEMVQHCRRSDAELLKQCRATLLELRTKGGEGEDISYMRWVVEELEAAWPSP